MRTAIRPASMIRTLGALGLLASAACGGSTTDPTQVQAGVMTATIDGSSWSAPKTQVSAAYSNGILAIGGTDAQGRTIGIGTSAAAPGTYSVGATNPTNFSLMVGSASWNAVLSNGSGSITITTLTATSAKGTFQFTAVPVASSGATGTRQITQGTFDLTF